MLFTCIAANIQGINRKDSIIHHTICCEDTIRKDDPFAVNEKLVLIVKSEDISAGKEETWIGKYGGVIL